MRWKELFDDLEARFEEHERVATEFDLVELVHAERDRITLVDRLGAHLGAVLVTDIRDGSVLRGRLLDVGRDWLLLRAPGMAGRAADVVIPLAAVASLGGLSQQAVISEGRPVRRLRMGALLRGLAQNRSGVSIDVWPQGRLDGTIDRVGADHLDLAVHPLDVARRPGDVGGVRTVPFDCLAAVRSR